MIPDSIMDLYDLHKLVVNGFVYAEVRRGMYGLPQAAIIANKQLQEKLAPHGYRPVPITPGLWKHDTRDIAFALVVDDFGVKYTKRDDAEHLVNTLQNVGYKLSQEWDGNRYCGLTLNGTTTSEHVMCLCQDTSSEPSNASNIQHQPEQNIHHIIGISQNMEQRYNMLTPMILLQCWTPLKRQRVQEIIGTFLFYARAVDITMLKALGTMSTQQSKPTEATMKASSSFLTMLQLIQMPNYNTLQVT